MTAASPARTKTPGLRAAAVATLAALLLAAAPARAQIIDRLEVAERGENAEIAIRFGSTVQYLRHAPPGKGRLLVIELQVTGPQDSEIGGRLVSETRVSPRTDLVPAFEATYVAARKSLTVEFKREVSWRVRGSGDGRAIYIQVPLPAEKLAKSAPPVARPSADARPAGPATPPAKPSAGPAAAPAPPAKAAGEPIQPASSPEAEKDGAASLAKAKASLEAGRFDEAIETLNRALNLPPGGFSREAQELIGIARERNGEPSKARAEFELYLKLYTDPEGVARVKARLAALGKAPPPGAAAVREAKPVKSVYGSFSTIYYRGATKYDATILPPQPGLQPDLISLTSTDQSSFVTNIDLTGRYQQGPWDHKLVVRDTWTASLLDRGRDENRLAAAYYEMNQKERDWSLRVGRQSAVGGGVLGRFDGAWGRAGLRPGVRLNVVGGQTVEYYSAPKRNLFGASVDLGPWNNALSASLYAIEQRLDGLVDRRAFGTEMRYFDAKRNGFLLLDYDTRFSELSIAMLQANWLTDAGTNLAFLYDRRRSPPLQVSNASAAYSGAAIGDLVGTGISYRDLLEQAKRITPVSDLLSLGATHPLGKRWQVGADVKLSRVSGTGAAGQLAASPDSGDLWIYTLQGIGTGLANANDVLVTSVSLNRGRVFDGFTGSLTYLRVIDRWRVEGNLKYYAQTDRNDIELRRWTPSARAGYRWGEHLTFEGEAGAEFTRTSGPAQTEDTRRHYFNLGVRWDFY